MGHFASSVAPQRSAHARDLTPRGCRPVAGAVRDGPISQSEAGHSFAQLWAARVVTWRSALVALNGGGGKLARRRPAPTASLARQERVEHKVEDPSVHGGR